MRVRASSLNYRDLMVLKAGGRGPTKLGVVPLSDGAGEVAAIGEGVTRAKIGDRIAGCFHPRWFGGPIKPDYLTDRLGTNLDGMLAEYAVFNEEAVVVLPSHLSFEEAATLPCAAVTAWVALTGHRRVTAGDTVLTQGSGGVSIFALQFARVLGARVIATTSTAEKAERLKALGASEVINYTETPDWDEKARGLTDGRGVDCVVEIGGPGTIAKSLKASQWAGMSAELCSVSKKRLFWIDVEFLRRQMGHPSIRSPSKPTAICSRRRRRIRLPCSICSLGSSADYNRRRSGATTFDEPHP
jgi:NADPH:quinone reductase-like Zn-dependent oxidoreductase